MSKWWHRLPGAPVRFKLKGSRQDSISNSRRGSGLSTYALFAHLISGLDAHNPPRSPDLRVTIHWVCLRFILPLNPDFFDLEVADRPESVVASNDVIELVDFDWPLVELVQPLIFCPHQFCYPLRMELSHQFVHLSWNIGFALNFLGDPFVIAIHNGLAESLLVDCPLNICASGINSLVAHETVGALLQFAGERFLHFWSEQCNYDRGF
jgi:hypothetical protein